MTRREQREKRKKRREARERMKNPPLRLSLMQKGMLLVGAILMIVGAVVIYL